MRRYLPLVVLSLIIVIISAIVVFSHQEISIPKENMYNGCYSNVLHAPAVTSDGKGVIVDVDIKVCPGSGKIFVNLGPLVGLDLQRTISNAVKVANNILGGELSNKDIYIYFNASAKIVEGPSIGAALTAAIYYTALGKPFPSDVCITGTISKDGKIGEVGGIIEKAEACKNSGMYIFVFPKDEVIIETIECKKYVRRFFGGIFEYEECYPTAVNLSRKISEMGLRPVPVADIRDLIEVLEGRE